ncbi:MAG: cysteine-rich CWC family protein [Ferruginibacter sp.]
MEKLCKHEEKACPRCGSAFECKVGDIVNCQCHGIRFTNEMVAYLSKHYDDCLCRACLLELNSEHSILSKIL